jgi:hypothetical protein
MMVVMVMYQVYDMEMEMQMAEMVARVISMQQNVVNQQRNLQKKTKSNLFNMRDEARLIAHRC